MMELLSVVAIKVEDTFAANAWPPIAFAIVEIVLAEK